MFNNLCYPGKIAALHPKRENDEKTSEILMPSNIRRWN